MKGNILCLLSLGFIIPGVLYMFSRYSPPRAVMLCFLGALMFLPMEELQVPLILYNKMTATAIGVMLGIMIYDENAPENFSFGIVDIPMLIWILSGVFAAVLNDLGLKDGIQEGFNTLTQWGIPYLAGRLYFSDPKAQKMLCYSFFMAGLLYIPFVVFELVMSPQCHNIVYGYMQHSFAQVIRGGGYRPMVFMEHGIMLGTLMAMAALVGVWCTYTGVFPRKIYGVPTPLLSLILVFSALICKSSLAIGLMLIGIFALLVSEKLKVGLIIWVMLLIPPTYISLRATGYWDGANLVTLVSEKFSEDRAASLAFRFDNENILVRKAMEKPVFGWGGWGRSRVYDEETGEDLSTTDGFWIITMGRRGLLGLGAVSLVLLLPMLQFVIKTPPGTWKRPEIAPTAVLAIIPLLFLIDCTLNAMVNQIYIIIAGGISGMMRGTFPVSADLTDNMSRRLPDDKEPVFEDRPEQKTRFRVHSEYRGPRFGIRR